MAAQEIFILGEEDPGWAEEEDSGAWDTDQADDATPVVPVPSVTSIHPSPTGSINCCCRLRVAPRNRREHIMVSKHIPNPLESGIGNEVANLSIAMV